MGVSENMGKPPKSSILIGVSIVNHPFWGPTPIFGNTHLELTGTLKCSSYLLNALGYAFFEIQDQQKNGIGCEVIKSSVNQ